MKKKSKNNQKVTQQTKHTENKRNRNGVSNKAFRSSYSNHPNIVKAISFLSSTQLEKMDLAFEFMDEKRESKKQDPFLELKLSLVKTARSFLSPGSEYRFKSGSYYTLIVNAAGSFVFDTVKGSAYNHSYINCILDAQVCPDYSAYYSLFDEAKVMGIDFHYLPYGRYQSGASTMFGVSQASNRPCVILFDSDTSNWTNTPTYQNMAYTINRDDQHFHVIVPTDPFACSFSRPGRDSDYPWVDLQVPVNTDPAYRGSLAVFWGGSELQGLGGLGMNPIPIGEGYFKYHLAFRIRL